MQISLTEHARTSKESWKENFFQKNHIFFFKVNFLLLQIVNPWAFTAFFMGFLDCGFYLANCDIGV